MIQRLFKTHFWVFQVGFLLLCCYLSAQSTSHLIASVLPAAIPFRLGDNPLRTRNIDRKLADNVFMNRQNLFTAKETTINTPKVRPSKTVSGTDQDKKETPLQGTCPSQGVYNLSKNLPLSLLGTSVAKNPVWSIATLYDSQENKNIAVRTGELYKGIRICMIEPRRLKIDRGRGQLEYILLGAAAGKLNRNAYLATYRKLRKRSFDTRAIRSLGKGRYRVPKAFLNQISERLDVLASKAAIMPYFEKGKPAGFKIYNIKRGSLYEKIGIKNGDVIRQINGYKFNNIQRVLQAYGNLRNASSLNVSIQRGGKVEHMRYEMQD
ncbi:MAG: type II secretion system protein GspC [Myxococcota bacterium]